MVDIVSDSGRAFGGGREVRGVAPAAADDHVGLHVCSRALHPGPTPGGGRFFPLRIAHVPYADA
jgi:hypothetical protein